jgi:hypothetical protein
MLMRAFTLCAGKIIAEVLDFIGRETGAEVAPFPHNKIACLKAFFGSYQLPTTRFRKPKSAV